MKMKYATILLTFIFLLGSGVSAEAELRDEVVVTIPYEFVAAGKTLPAGSYSVSRVSSDKFGGLVISSKENHSSVVVLPIEVESTATINSELSFQHVGEQYFLSKIQTASHVYSIAVSHSAIMEAATKSPNSMPASGSAGNN